MNKKWFWLGFTAGIVLSSLLVFLAVEKFMIQPDVALTSMKMEDLNGQPVKIEQLLGKPIVINYWATWCAPCKQEFPFLKQQKRNGRTKRPF